MLTPLDIENKRFSKKINGYNADEVDDFLDQVTDDYEKIYRENAELRDAIEECNKELERYKNVEQTLQNTLVMAQTTADDIKAGVEKSGGLYQFIYDEWHNLPEEMKREIALNAVYELNNDAKILEDLAERL